MTLYIMVGPPCSGKSTIAKELAGNRSTIRINRDELRVMLKGKYVVGNKMVENTIELYTEVTIGHAVRNKLDVIVDATHVKEKYINEVKSYVPDGYNVTIKYIVCDEPLWKLHVRNVWRYIKTGFKTWIPPHVIESMYFNFQEVKLLIANNKI